MKKLIFAAIVVSVALVIACNWRLHTRTPPKEKRVKAPAFSLPDHQGNTHTLEGLLKGGAGVLIFYRGHW